MAIALGFGEEVNLMSGELLQKLALEQAPAAVRIPSGRRPNAVWQSCSC